MRVTTARVTIKTWQKPETALEKSLAPRVWFLRFAQCFTSGCCEKGLLQCYLNVLLLFWWIGYFHISFNSFWWHLFIKWFYLIFIDVGQSSLKQTRPLERGCSLSSWNLSNTWIFSCTLSLILSPNSAPGQQQGKQHPSPILDETSVSRKKGQKRPIHTWNTNKIK